MSKRRLRFFIDFGNCFWDAGTRGGALSPEDLPLSPSVQCEVKEYLRDYDQHYDWGCPPSDGWTIEDCKRFNAETKRIFSLVEPQLRSQFIICHEQEDLTEDPEHLAEILKDRRAFIERQRHERSAQ